MTSLIWWSLQAYKHLLTASPLESKEIGVLVQFVFEWKLVLLLLLLLFDAIISANNDYYLHLRFATADDESVLNSIDIEWSKENLPQMTSLEEENIEPPRKVARPGKVTTIMIPPYYHYFINPPQFS